MNTYVLTADALTVAGSVILAATALIALAIRLLDDLRSTRRKDSAATIRNLRNAQQWDHYRGRLNPSRLPMEKL